METPGGESSVNTNDELNKFELSPNMDSSVVDSVPYSSLDATLKETCGLRYKDVIAMKFDSVEDAKAFYHCYSRVVGFGVCEKQVLPHKKYMCNTNSKRRPQLQTIVGCKACFFVSLDRYTNKYSIKAFEENHCLKLATFREVAWCLVDVLVFDNTYKTNAYAKPLVLFFSVNNHCATCVFRVALSSDETMQSYRWVLNTFMESMEHKQPIYILI
ncbi:hypothetical protein Dsin_005684 [Dipteronia sinensis]|uniref:MULE transposase domain-containing protein n=1 Tax=Dipteronia sinensis TaxID=43782 RepID=A0AAE0AYA3_9ROSI|nr:hypothetical protein Dsin_005684 [Dipteronia sinensis]